MNTTTEHTITTANEPLKEVSLEEQILALGESSVTCLGEVLGIKSRTMSSYLDAIGRKDNFDDRIKGTTRYITLTREGVKELLEEHTKRMSKVIEERTVIITPSPEMIEEEGILFAEFKRLFFLENKIGNAREAWMFLTTKHTGLFGDASKKGINSLYKLKKNSIEQALLLAKAHSQEIAEQIEAKKRPPTKRISRQREEFLCES